MRRNLTAELEAIDAASACPDERFVWSVRLFCDEYRRATTLTSATTSPSRGSAAAVEGDAVGAAAVGRGSAAASRSNKKRTPAATGVLHDDSGQRAAAGEA